MMNNINGLVAAVYTPFTLTGEINLGIVQDYTKWLVENNVKGAFINGSTGDFSSLTIQERKIILEEWCKHKPKDFILVCQVGDSCHKNSMDLAYHASTLNVDAISTLPPFYHKPSSIEDLIDLCSSIAKAAPTLPLYYYHIPSLTGANFSMIDFLHRAFETIPNLRGIKYSYLDLADFALCKEFRNGHYDMLFGMDDLIICGLTLGARGMVGTTYNYIAPLYNQIIEYFKENRIEEANSLQLKSIAFIKTLFSYGFAGSGRYCMKLAGLDCGPVRPPHRDLPSQEFERLKRQLADMDVIKYIQNKSLSKLDGRTNLSSS